MRKYFGFLVNFKAIKIFLFLAFLLSITPIFKATPTLLPELWPKVLSYLKGEDISALSRTCKQGNITLFPELVSRQFIANYVDNFGQVYWRKKIAQVQVIDQNFYDKIHVEAFFLSTFNILKSDYETMRKVKPPFESGLILHAGVIKYYFEKKLAKLRPEFKQELWGKIHRKLELLEEKEKNGFLIQFEEIQQQLLDPFAFTIIYNEADKPVDEDSLAKNPFVNVTFREKIDLFLAYYAVWKSFTNINRTEKKFNSGVFNLPLWVGMNYFMEGIKIDQMEFFKKLVLVAWEQNPDKYFSHDTLKRNFVKFQWKKTDQEEISTILKIFYEHFRQ